MVHAFEQMQELYSWFAVSESHNKLTIMLENAAAASGSFTEASRHVLAMAQRRTRRSTRACP